MPAKEKMMAVVDRLALRAMVGTGVDDGRVKVVAMNE